ncbi:MAG: oligosaccharide flippase family protein [Calditrichia bacterium]
MKSIFKKFKNISAQEDNKILVSNFFSLSILQGSYHVLAIVRFPYLVNVLGAEFYGLIAFANAIIIYLGIITDYGFNLTATRDISIHREDKGKITEIFSSVMIVKFFLLIITLILLTVAILSLEKLQQYWYIYYFAFGTIIGQVLFPTWFFQGIEEMKYITILTLIDKSLYTAAIFIFVRVPSDFYLVPALASAGYMISGILSQILVYKKYQIRFRIYPLKVIKYYIVDGWHIFISRVFSSFYKSSNTVILGFLTNNIIVGYYAIAEKFIVIIQALQNVFGIVLYPYFSKKLSINKNAFFELNKKFIKYAVTIYFSLFLILLLSSKIVILFLFGPENLPSVSNLRILSSIVFIGGLNYYFGIVGLVSMNYKKEFSRYMIATSIVNVLVCLVLVKFLQDNGAAYSFLISELFLFTLTMSKIYKIKRNMELSAVQ